MRITVDHSTVYRYNLPVVLEPHIFRLRPRCNSAQRLLHYEVQITPTPAGTTECLDQDGNLALNAWFHAPALELSVRSRFTAGMLRENPFDYVLIGESLSLPLWYRTPLAAALAPYRQTEAIAEAVNLFAQSVLEDAQGNALWFLTTLTQRIFQTCRHVTRPAGAPWPSHQTLASAEWSCRDLAVLFCDASRAVGIAARFVSGYESASAFTNNAYMHAWAEVYLPLIGWRGYDPARGLAVSNGHVAVAAGFDAGLASPVAGWYSGLSGSIMETSISLRLDDGE